MRRVALLVVLCLAGCTGSVAPEPASAVLRDALADARAGGAGDDQLAALRQAQSAGAVSTEAVRAAAHRAVGCMRAAGLDARYHEGAFAHGVVVPGYLVHHEPDADEDTRAEACDAREFHWVSRAYQVQPSSIDASGRLVELHVPARVEFG